MLIDARPQTVGAPDVAPAVRFSPALDHQRLDAYVVALEFQALAARAVPRGHRELKDQLERASISIVLNLAEGAGRRLPLDKARFYTIARGSSTESAAIFDLLRIRRIAPESLCRQAQDKLVRIVQMLTRLEAAMLARSAGQ